MAWHGVWTNGTEAGSWPASYREENAEIIASYFLNEGWTIDAICAMLGNMQYESYLNPAQWQVGFSIYGGGFGLVQWTPYTKFSDWAGSVWKTNYNMQLYRIQHEMDAGEQWIPLSAYDNLSFYDWSRQTINDYSLEWLTNAFFSCYERGTDSEYRRIYARQWYQYFQGVAPPPWDPDDPPGPGPDPGPGGRYIPIWLLFKIKEANK